MPITVRVTGLAELQTRFRDFPGKFTKVINKAVEASLYALWESVPPYPAPPSDSSYIRTGTLGRTLGVGESGGMTGKPDIFEVREQGGYVSGQFGTNLEYAPYVIGDDDQATQHRGRWWTMKVIAERAQGKILDVFNAAVETMARWLDGKGL